MALIQLAPPYPVFTDKNGDPLDNGYLYFGVVNLNPETNPIQVYYDSTFTQPVAQPIRTSNGYPMRNGAPALIYAGSQFSVTVRDKNSDLVIYSPVGYGIDPGAIAGVVVVQDQTGDGVTTAFGMGASPSSENATNVFIDGVYQSKAGYSISGSTLTFSEAPPLYSAIEIVSNQTAIVGGTDAGLVTYNEGGAGAVTRTVQSRLRDFVSVKDFGAVGDGVTDDTAAIQAAIDSGALGITVLLPAGTYKVTDTILLKRTGVRLKGAGEGVTFVKYTNASGGILFSGDSNKTASLNTYERCAITDLEILSSAAGTDPDICVDLTSFSYGHFSLQAQNRRVNGVIFYGQGNAGTSPYFNHIESTGLFGNTDYTQTAFKFVGGAWAGGSNGPNANMIGPVTRGAALGFGVDLQVGQGNMFSQLSFESIGTAYLRLGLVSSYNDAGTSTGSNNQVTINDTSKSWTISEWVGGGIYISSGTGAGQYRRISNNIATQISLQDAWDTIPDATSTYALAYIKCAGNKFNQVRGEGLYSQNPDFIIADMACDTCVVAQSDISSLGSGKYLVDNSGSTRNSFFEGNRVVVHHTFENPGASFSGSAFPRTGAIGGLRLCQNYTVDWVSVSCNDAANDTATVTVDIGGSTVGGGLESLQGVLSSGSDVAVGMKHGNRSTYNGNNNALNISLVTGSSFSATDDVIVAVGTTLT
jgi:hypothetical protein